MKFRDLKISTRGSTDNHPYHSKPQVFVSAFTAPVLKVFEGLKDNLCFNQYRASPLAPPPPFTSYMLTKKPLFWKCLISWLNLLRNISLLPCKIFLNLPSRTLAQPETIKSIIKSTIILA